MKKKGKLHNKIPGKCESEKRVELLFSTNYCITQKTARCISLIIKSSSADFVVGEASGSVGWKREWERDTFVYRFFCVSFSYSTKASCTNRAASQSFICFYSGGRWGWIMWLAHRVRCGTRGSVTLPLKLHLKRQTQSMIRFSFSFCPIRWLTQRNVASR